MSKKIVHGVPEMVYSLICDNPGGNKGDVPVI